MVLRASISRVNIIANISSLKFMILEPLHIPTHVKKYPNDHSKIAPYHHFEFFGTEIYCQFFGKNMHGIQYDNLTLIKDKNTRG